MPELSVITEVATIPDPDTIAGLIIDFVAQAARQTPDAIGDASLAAFGIEQRMLILGAIYRCFGVPVPPDVIQPEIRTVRQLSRFLGSFVHDALRNRQHEPRSSASRRLLLVGNGVPEHEQAFARRGWRAMMLTHYNAAQESGPGVGVIHGVIDEVEAADWVRPLDMVGRIVDLYSAEHIDRVVPVDEFALLPAALATTQLGIPGPSVRSVRNTRDKLHMRRALEEAGLNQVRYSACHDPAQAEAFLEQIGGPIILKPVSGTGSDGVSLVRSSTELASAFQVAMGADGFSGILCEEYIDGLEVSLEGYSVDGRFVPVALTDKLTDDRFLEIGHQQPSSHPHTVFAAAAEIAERALAALGVENGVTHTEFRLAKQGPVLIETHTRMAGDRIHVLTHLTTGVDLADLMVAFSLGETVDDRPIPQGRAAAIRFLVGRPGRIRAVRVPPVEPGNGILAVTVPPVGKALSGRSSSRERLGHVIATAPTPELAAQTAESFLAQIQIDYFDRSDC